MTSKDETSIQIIATQRTWYRLLNAVFGFFSFFMGTVCFLAAIFVDSLPSESIALVPWIFMLSIVLLALSRNRILQVIFGRIPHSSFLSLVCFGRIVIYIITISGFSFFAMGLLIINIRLLLVSFGFFFIFFPIFLIFSEPMTYAGEIKLLFELLLANLDNFENRQPYLRAISKKVENQLKMGNIKVPHNEFVYYSNMELLKGTDVKDDLKNIEAWIVDKKTLCFESLKKIYPENKLEPCKRYSLSRQLVENQAATKYILYVVVALILVTASPELQAEILKLLKLFGI